MPARWLDAGTRPPFDLHAFYHGIAHALPPDGAPALIWGRSDRPHISLGPHQDAAAELVLDADGRAGGMEVVRRETGGGSVLVDGDQWVFAFVVPRRAYPGRPTELYGRLLPAVQAAFAQFGLRVTRGGPNDLWCEGRKIGGTGMATLGNALVLVGSFLLRFDAVRFAAAVNCPSATFRRFLAAGLGEVMAPWAAFGPLPPATRLRHALRIGLVRELGWVVMPDGPTPEEWDAIAESRSELLDPDWRWEPQGRRAIAGGVKLKGDAFLTEDRIPGVGRVTVQTEAGRIRRLAIEGMAAAATATAVGEPPQGEGLGAILGREPAAAVAAVAVCSEEQGARRRPRQANDEEATP